MEGIHMLSSAIQGVLGQEFLSRFDYLLDFTSRRIVFNVPSPKGGSRLDFTLVHGRPTIKTSEGQLVLDSGTDSPVLFRAPAAALGFGSGAQLFTNSGASAGAVLSSVRLKIAGTGYRASNAAVLPKSSSGEEGLLPASLFRAVYVSTSGNYVVLNPNLESSKKRN